MKEFNESGLLFKFNDQWEVFQLDKEVVYVEIRRLETAVVVPPD